MSSLETMASDSVEAVALWQLRAIEFEVGTGLSQS